MKKKTLKQDIEFLSDALDCYIWELNDVQEKLNGANGIIAKQIAHIEMINRQLDQSNHYNNRKDEENKLLKRMYRDDIVNNYREL